MDDESGESIEEEVPVTATGDGLETGRLVAIWLTKRHRELITETR